MFRTRIADTDRTPLEAKTILIFIYLYVYPRVSEHNTTTTTRKVIVLDGNPAIDYQAACVCVCLTPASCVCVCVRSLHQLEGRTRGNGVCVCWFLRCVKSRDLCWLSGR